jgi:hypothetical protein
MLVPPGHSKSGENFDGLNAALAPEPFLLIREDGVVHVHARNPQTSGFRARAKELKDCSPRNT